MSKCGSCAYYIKVEEGVTVGFCRRRAPSQDGVQLEAIRRVLEGMLWVQQPEGELRYRGSDEVYARWPRVTQDDWCGEYLVSP